jgi:hypothetical protein
MRLDGAYERCTSMAAPPITAMASRPASRASNSTMTPTPRPAATTTPGVPIKPRTPPGTRLSWLTPEEMARRHEEGLCFNCPEKFSWDHLKQCSMKGIYLLEMDSDNTMEDTFVDDTAAQISLNALTSVTNAETMQLPLTLAKQDINALVDSGSTHYFVADRTAQCLSLHFLPREGMAMGVANGERLPCSGVCSSLPITIKGEAFNIDFFIITLEGHEVVLDCSWLRTLGPIIWDFKHMSMVF